MAINMKFRESPAKYISWQIPKFFDLPTEQGYVLDSSSFSLFGAKEKWYLQILPNDTADAHELFIILRLVKEASSVERRVAFKMGITYVGGKDVKSDERNEIFKIERDWYGTVLIKRSTLRSTTDAVASDGTLTVFCTATIVDKPALFSSMEAATRITVTTLTPTPSSVTTLTPTPPSVTTVAPTPPSVTTVAPTPSSVTTVAPFSQTPLTVTTIETASQTTTAEGITTLIENLKNLYFSKRCADVKITVKGREFLAHSHILTARSKVFFSMFNSDMVEKNSGIVDITDCDPTSFEDFLIFIYTGNLEVVSSRNATSLYETAEKYDLQDLKKECLKCMISELTVDSFCDVLHLAVMYNETGVLASVTNFFIENARSILLTTKWTDFMAENTLLGNELVLKFVDKHIKKKVVRVQLNRDSNAKANITET